MNLYLKWIADGLILLIGLILFFSSLLNNNLNLALAFLIAAIILWVINGLFFNTFSILTFSWIISSAGFLLSICVFFIYGIEQVAHPNGAIIFHSSGIAGSLGIGLFSLFPILFIRQINNQYTHSKSNKSNLNNFKDLKNTPDKSKTTEKGKSQITKEISSDDWEIATDEDIDSGKYDLS